jgi:hypothetical protein
VTRRVNKRPEGCMTNEGVRIIQNRALAKCLKYLKRNGFKASDFYNLDLREKERANNVR